MKVFEIVAVYDNLTEAYLEPHFFGTLAEAERVFAFQINDIPLWRENASDYDLYSLGRFDSETGQIMPEIHKICGGKSVLRKEKTESDSHTV